MSQCPRNVPLLLRNTHLSHVGVSKNRGTQNGWFIMEIRIKMDDFGGKPTIFGNPHVGPSWSYLVVQDSIHLGDLNFVAWGVGVAKEFVKRCRFCWILVGGNLQRNHETNIGLTLPETYFGGFDWFWFGLVGFGWWRSDGCRGDFFLGGGGKIWWLHGFSLWYDLGSRRICFSCSFLPTPIICSWIDLFVWCFFLNLLAFFFYPGPYHPCIISIFTYIYHGYQPNVGKYSIHGWYGIVWGCTNSLYRWSPPCRCGPTMAPRPVKVLVGKVLVASSKLDPPPWTPAMMIKTDRELDNSTTCRNLVIGHLWYFQYPVISRLYSDYLLMIFKNRTKRNVSISWIITSCRMFVKNIRASLLRYLKIDLLRVGSCQTNTPEKLPKPNRKGSSEPTIVFQGRAVKDFSSPLAEWD